MIQQTHWRKGAFKYYFKCIANITNHLLGILKPKYCSLGLRAGHYRPWISVYFEGVAANKQGIDDQWPLWPPLNLRPGVSIYFPFQIMLLQIISGHRNLRSKMCPWPIFVVVESIEAYTGTKSLEYMYWFIQLHQQVVPSWQLYIFYGFLLQKNMDRNG
jgi:hypothetical protein